MMLFLVAKGCKFDFCVFNRSNQLSNFSKNWEMLRGKTEFYE